MFSGFAYTGLDDSDRCWADIVSEITDQNGKPFTNPCEKPATTPMGLCDECRASLIGEAPVAVVL